MTLNLIFARSRNGVIGNNNSLPWHLPEDLAHFKRVTAGKTVIMGRKTWDSIPAAFRPLPGRQNMVLTDNPDWSEAGAVKVDSLEQAVRQAGDSECWVIGGASLYEQALPFATAAWVTEIDQEFEGDTCAPTFGREWHKCSHRQYVSSTGLGYSLVQMQNLNVLRLGGPFAAPGEGFSDKGPWSAGKTDEPTTRVFVQSDTFKNDVRLYVDGDFWGVGAKMAYATELADFLNRARMPAACETN